jgi:hypothetical protein
MTARTRRRGCDASSVLLACMAGAGTLLSGCFASPPDLSKINCKDNGSCPSGYVCQLPGQVGGCRRATDGGGSEAAAIYDAATTVDLTGNIDGAKSDETSAAIDSGAESFTPDGGLTVPIDSSNVSTDESTPSDISGVTPVVDSGNDTPDTRDGESLDGSGRPAGYWMSSDWNLTGVNWAGCVWTQVDNNVTASSTSISPQDFTTNHQPSDSYHVNGTVFNDYNAIAAVGFNLNEAITDDSSQCAHKVFDSTTVLPPGVTFPSSAGGLTIDWTESTQATAFRVELLGPTGVNDATQRWCANITDITGPTFVPFSSFNTTCWMPSAGTGYSGEAVSAVAFYVPGTATKKSSFDFSINRFNIAHTIGGSATLDSSSQRVKVIGSDGRQYIVQNNNFGNPTGSTQMLSYANNSFEILSSTMVGSLLLASFPSIYIGANGMVAAGAYETTDDNLPMQINAIASAQGAFAWSGGTGSKDFDVAYDLWFARTAVTAGTYNDAVSGDLMIWLYKPANRQPTGKLFRSVTLAGHTWNVWVGPRGTTSTGTDDTGRPVVSYVAQDSPVLSLTLDLKSFINDAVTNGAADEAAASTSQAFANTWYLTDIFGGFQIWTGSDATGLQCTNFACVIQ